MNFNLFSDLFFHAPDKEQMVKKSPDIVKTVLEDMGNYKNSVGFAMTIKDTAKVLLIMIDSEEWGAIVQRIMDSFCDFFRTCDKFLLPSELREEFLKSVALYCADCSERKELVEELTAMFDISVEAANFFWGTFIRKFANELLAYYIHFMVHNGEDYVAIVPVAARFVLTSQPTDTLDFKQTMHYVGGANVKSILRAALKIKNKNHEWLRVIEVVKKYFLISEFAAAPEAELMAWTETQDRGGLTKISSNLLNFYVNLGATVKIMEHCDGSLYVDEVMEKVMESSTLLCLWDETLKDALSKEQSFKLMHALCSYFCSTWRRGIITRRIDEMSAVNESVGVKHGMSGVPFRATIPSQQSE